MKYLKLFEHFLREGNLAIIDLTNRLERCGSVLKEYLPDLSDVKHMGNLTILNKNNPNSFQRFMEYKFDDFFELISYLGKLDYPHVDILGKVEPDQVIKDPTYKVNDISEIEDHIKEDLLKCVMYLEKIINWLDNPSFDKDSLRVFQSDDQDEQDKFSAIKRIIKGDDDWSTTQDIRPKKDTRTDESNDIEIIKEATSMLTGIYLLLLDPIFMKKLVDNIKESN